MTKKGRVYVHGVLAGHLVQDGSRYTFTYLPDYHGEPVSLTMPLREQPYTYDRFPPFFEGVLPEGPQLEALLRHRKLDRSDFMGQLLAVGTDVVGAVTVLDDTP